MLVLMGCISMACAQKNKPTIAVKDEVIGRDCLWNKEIVAKKYKFLRRIFRSQVDTTLGILTIQLIDTVKKTGKFKNGGCAVAFSMGDDKVLWEREMNYSLERAEAFGEFLIIHSKQKDDVYYTRAGNKMWEMFGNIVYVHRKVPVGLAIPFDFSGDPKNRLQGLSMFTGEKLWERKIDYGYGMNDILPLNDSVVLVVSAGLHTVNLDSGKGWDYDAVTGKRDYTAMILGNIAGLAMGVLTRGSLFYVTGYSLKRDMMSNVWVSDTTIYMASRKEIVRLNVSGDVIWRTALPDDFVSTSAIFVDNGLVYMVNYGAISQGQRQCAQGTPFWTAFDVRTGERQFFEMYEKKDPLVHFTVKDQTVLLMQKNKITKSDLLDNSLMATFDGDTATYGEFCYFTGEGVYVKRDSTYGCLTEVDPSCFYVKTSRDSILTLNYSLKVVDRIAEKECYICYATKGSYKFLYKDGKTIIINRDHREVATLDVDHQSVLIGSVLYNVGRTDYSIIDLSGVIGE